MLTQPYGTSLLEQLGLRVKQFDAMDPEDGQAVLLQAQRYCRFTDRALNCCEQVLYGLLIDSHSQLARRLNAQGQRARPVAGALLNSMLTGGSLSYFEITEISAGTRNHVSEGDYVRVCLPRSVLTLNAFARFEVDWRELASDEWNDQALTPRPYVDVNAVEPFLTAISGNTLKRDGHVVLRQGEDWRCTQAARGRRGEPRSESIGRSARTHLPAESVRKGHSENRKERVIPPVISRRPKSPCDKTAHDITRSFADFSCRKSRASKKMEEQKSTQELLEEANQLLLSSDSRPYLQRSVVDAARLVQRAIVQLDISFELHQALDLLSRFDRKLTPPEVEARIRAASGLLKKSLQRTKRQSAADEEYEQWIFEEMIGFPNWPDAEPPLLRG